MKLSVIVPAFKLENYIGECLTSVLTQTTNFDFEVVVCDDASPDGTKRVISKLEKQFPRLKAIYKKQNAGLAENMRTLIESATGEYIAYMDGDDLALPGKLQQQVDYLDAHQTCAMVYHESDVFDSDTNESLKDYSTTFYNWKYIPPKANISHLIQYGTFMQASSVMFRNHAALWKCVPDNCKIILDYPFYILNAGYLDGTIDFIDETLGRYRIHQGSFGAQTQKNAQRREQSLDDIVQACIEARRFNIEENIIQKGIAHHNYAAALYFLFRQDIERFQSFIRQSVELGVFFDDKHELVWTRRHNPQQIIELIG